MRPSRERQDEHDKDWAESRSPFATQAVPRSHAPWTEDEDAKLLEAWEDGVTVQRLASQHCRSRGAIKSRLKKMGLDPSKPIPVVGVDLDGRGAASAKPVTPWAPPNPPAGLDEWRGHVKEGQLEEAASHILRDAYGPESAFRDDQLDGIMAVVRQRRRLVLVQRTGWGKSVVYFTATRLMRLRGDGPTLVITPLVALMRDQIRKAKENFRLAADTLHYRKTSTENEATLARWMAGEVDILFVSPERLGDDRFEEATAALRAGIGLFVVDECHTISEWGHDFRPDYQRIARHVSRLARNVPVLGTTATAPKKVCEDIRAQLGDDVDMKRGPLARRSLSIHVLDIPSKAERLAWLAEHVPTLNGSGIIYTLTRRDSDNVTQWLKGHGVDVEAYHAKVKRDDEPDAGKADEDDVEPPPDLREELEGRLLRNELKALVATVALGMGFDKKDLGFVVHFQRPGSPVAYYQQIGRAGRELDHADAVLLAGEEDETIHRFFIERAPVTEDEMASVLEAVEAHQNGARLKEIQATVDLRQKRIEQCLRHLIVARAVVYRNKTYRRTANPWSFDDKRVAAVKAARVRDLETMDEFVRAHPCYMELIQRVLDDDTAAPCGRCANCTGERMSADIEATLTKAAADFLDSHYIELRPRKRWLSPDGKDGWIDRSHQLEEGRALCWYNEGPLGQAVHDGKYEQEQFSELLVEGAAKYIRDVWQPKPAPEWVTAVPSTRSGRLVPDFARRLAARLDLQYQDLIRKVHDTRQNKECMNSYQKVANLQNAFRAKGEAPRGPVLLVDDLVDSQWTFTIVGMELRKAGSGPVFPFALAQTRGGVGP